MGIYSREQMQKDLKKMIDEGKRLEVGVRVRNVFNGKYGTIQAIEMVADLETYFVLIDGTDEAHAFYRTEIIAV